MSDVAGLQDRLQDGSLLASGPFIDTAVKSTLLVSQLTCNSQAAEASRASGRCGVQLEQMFDLGN